MERFKGKEDHSTEGAYCSSCNTLFTTKGDLEEHLAKGTAEGCRGRKGEARTPAAASSSYSCEDCPKMFTSISHLNRHRQSVHLKKVHPCTEEGCPKTFTRADYLQRHIKTIHEGAKPFKCWRCGVSFSRKESLKQHEESVHLGIKKYCCSECNTSFTQKKDLQRHLASIHGQGERRVQVNKKTHVCATCEKAFPRPSVLKKHVEAAHPEVAKAEEEAYLASNPHVCKEPRCGKRFPTLIEKKRHQSYMHTY